MSEREQVDLRRLLQRLAIALLWVLVAFYSLVVHVPWLFSQDMVGFDCFAYWRAAHLDGNIYATPIASEAPYYYSPAFALLVGLLAWLPFAVFQLVWAALELGVILWLLKPGKLKWTVPLFILGAVPELILGNVYPFLALALVLSLSPSYRRGGPAAAAFLVLTKLTPGLPILFFAIRRDWRALALALGTTAVAVAVSVALVPDQWANWLHFLTGGGPTLFFFPVRAALAVILVVVAALWGRPALVPVAVLLTLPVIGGSSVFTLLAAVPRLSGVTMPPLVGGGRAHSRPRENAASRS